MPSPVVTETLKSLKLAAKSEQSATKKMSAARRDTDFDIELEKAKPKPAAKSPSPAKPDGKRKTRVVTRKSRAADGSTTEKVEHVEIPPAKQSKLTASQDDQEAAADAAQASVVEQSPAEAKGQAAAQNPMIVIPQAGVVAQNKSPDATDGNAKSAARAVPEIARQVLDADQAATVQGTENDSVQEEAPPSENGDRAQDQSADRTPAPTSFKRLPGSIEPVALGETAPPVTDQPSPETGQSVAKTGADVAQATAQELTVLNVDQPADALPRAAAPAPAHHDLDPQESVVSLFQQKLDGGRAVEHAPASAPPSPPPAPDAQFAAENHPRIISGIRGELIPGGGTMHIRLDPPELGALQVTVHMEDGVMSAMFQTSTDDATRLLSHSLSQLKHVLETQGVSVEKLHVQQSPRDERQSFDDAHQQRQSEYSSAQHEQQRREMLRRMWRRLTDGSDPLDMVA